jgi:hypothetical protein
LCPTTWKVHCVRWLQSLQSTVTCSRHPQSTDRRQHTNNRQQPRPRLSLSQRKTKHNTHFFYPGHSLTCMSLYCSGMGVSRTCTAATAAAAAWSQHTADLGCIVSTLAFCSFPSPSLPPDSPHPQGKPQLGTHRVVHVAPHVGLLCVVQDALEAQRAVHAGVLYQVTVTCLGLRTKAWG